MPGIKRKEVPGAVRYSNNNAKKIKTKSGAVKPSHNQALKAQLEKSADDLVESDTTESSAFGEISDHEASRESSVDELGNVQADEDIEMTAPKPSSEISKAPQAKGDTNIAANSNSSRESHAKQKILVLERKAAKPNADVILRSKKIWERLRRKSHVPLAERKELVTELFDIITGRVKDFVLKHDSVRVIQTALKYANLEQRKMIARELAGEYRGLAESRYAKFLIGKLLVHGDAEIRDMIIPEFYGHVRRLIKHAEASWILDDIYRGVATPQQRATILREWYGAEFALFQRDQKSGITATLSDILEQSPEKRSPIMRSLHELINHLVQKNMSGFTLLHDAILQYFLNTRPGSEEASELIELLKGDEEGDLLKNLAFTRSGAEVVCLSLAYGSAKDRKHILKTYKDTIGTLASDVQGHMILLTAFDTIDDTVLTAKSIFPEMLGKDAAPETQQENILTLAGDPNARVVLLYLFAGKAKWLMPTEDITLIEKVHGIRTTTSKKDPEARRSELVKGISRSALATIAAQAGALIQTSFGCQFITEVLLGADGDKKAAIEAIAEVAMGKPTTEGHISQSPAAGRMLKTLVSGGRYSAKAKKVVPIDPPLHFGDVFYSKIGSQILDWAVGPSSFVVVGLLEAKDFESTDELLSILKKHKKALSKAAEEETNAQKSRIQPDEVDEAKGVAKQGGKHVRETGNKGTKLLLKKMV
ncbi:MAG: pumilio domain member 6 [Pycnora praestabilis]|nr:MAG: pumilio domain member 6 [Pycnora praestabilis]